MPKKCLSHLLYLCIIKSKHISKDDIFIVNNLMLFKITILISSPFPQKFLHSLSKMSFLISSIMKKNKPKHRSFKLLKSTRAYLQSLTFFPLSRQACLIREGITGEGQAVVDRRSGGKSFEWQF